MARILRVSIKGAMPTGEEWSVNPVFSVGGDFGTPVSAVQAQAVATAIAAVAVPTGLLNAMSTSTNVNSIRVEARNLDGTLESQAEANKPAAAAGSGTQTHPFQTSVVISLRTGTPGPSGRGRVYWPATGITLDIGTLRISATPHGAVLAGWKTFLSAIEVAIEATLPGVAPTVWSRKGAGSTSPITSLQVGNVADVQRRRRDTLIESYQSVAYP